MKRLLWLTSLIYKQTNLHYRVCKCLHFSGWIIFRSWSQVLSAIGDRSLSLLLLLAVKSSDCLVLIIGDEILYIELVSSSLYWRINRHCGEPNRGLRGILTGIFVPLGAVISGKQHFLLPREEIKGWKHRILCESSSGHWTNGKMSSPSAAEPTPRIFGYKLPLRFDFAVVFLVFVSLTPVVYSHPEFTVQQLLSEHFPHRISDDIYLDPCKAGTIFQHLTRL